MKKYRKKPVVVEVKVYDGSQASCREILTWMGEKSCGWITFSESDVCTCETDNIFMEIETPKGLMKVLPGDFVVGNTIEGFYPCKPDVFIKTYEETNEW